MGVCLMSDVKNPNIILLALDSLRPDHMSCYGYERKTTSNIDEFAEKNILIENAYSAGASSPSSHLSMFTGRYVSNNCGLSEPLHVADGSRTLAGVLGDHGYATYGLVHPGIERVKGITEVFGKITKNYDPSDDLMDISYLVHRLRNVVLGPDNNTLYNRKKIQKWMRNQNDPFFVFANLSNPHSPYLSPYPFKTQFLKDGLEVDRKKIARVFGIKPHLEILKDKITSRDHSMRERRMKYQTGNMEITDDEFNYVKSFYDGAISYVDKEVGRFLDFLKEEGYYENSLIFITADHGECFGEHGLLFHGANVYDEFIRVPLLVKTPNNNNRVLDDGFVSLVDIFPTILDILDTNENPILDGKEISNFEKESLRDYIYSESIRNKKAAEYCEENYPNSSHSHFTNAFQTIRTEKYKLILDSKGEKTLFDVENDPSERSNVMDENPDTTKRLENRLRSELGNMDFPGETKGVRVDEEMQKRLRELGYFG